MSEVLVPFHLVPSTKALEWYGRFGRQPFGPVQFVQQLLTPLLQGRKWQRRPRQLAQRRWRGRRMRRRSRWRST
eukprot:2832582-Rhodomonas_salina.4